VSSGDDLLLWDVCYGVSISLLSVAAEFVGRIRWCDAGLFCGEVVDFLGYRLCKSTKIVFSYSQISLRIFAKIAFLRNRCYT
jgi:hypothetical protein